MKKLIPLILLTALVGCAEYDSITECKIKERQKIEGEVNGRDLRNIEDYCRSLRPDKCTEGADLLFEGKITWEEYENWEYPEMCNRW